MGYMAEQVSTNTTNQPTHNLMTPFCPCHRLPENCCQGVNLFGDVFVETATTVSILSILSLSLSIMVTVICYLVTRIDSY